MNVFSGFFKQFWLPTMKKTLLHSLLGISAGNSNWESFKCGWWLLKNPEEFRAGEDMPDWILIHLLWQDWLY